MLIYFFFSATEPLRLLVETKYNQFISIYFFNEQFAEMFIVFVITVLFYWALGLLFFIIDLTKKPCFIYRYKIQQHSSQILNINWQILVKQVLINQGIQMLVVSILAITRHRFIPSMINSSVPTLPRFAFELLFFLLVQEAVTYYVHRVFHFPSFYRRFHKKHHQWTTPIALSAIYCHPVEHLVINLFPSILGPLLMHSHDLTIYTWYCYVVVDANLIHGGYQFPLSFISPVFHDYHHLK